MTRARARAWRYAAALCGLVVVVDQALKAAVEANISAGEERAVAGPLSLTLSHNSGAAFGIGKGGGAVLLIVVAATLLLAGAAFARRAERPWMWVAFGLLAGGALGNVADRLRTGEVTDYIHVSVFSWPPFNLADVAITVAVLMFVLLYAHQSSDA